MDDTQPHPALARGLPTPQGFKEDEVSKEDQKDQQDSDRRHPDADPIPGLPDAGEAGIGIVGPPEAETNRVNTRIEVIAKDEYQCGGRDLDRVIDRAGEKPITQRGEREMELDPLRGLNNQ